MLFARTWMTQGERAHGARRMLFVRIFVVLCVSFVVVASVLPDPLPQVAASMDIDDLALAIDPLAFGPNGNLDPAKIPVPNVVARVPDLRFDDLRAARLASACNWRVSCVFEARGPPA